MCTLWQSARVPVMLGIQIAARRFVRPELALQQTHLKA